MPQSAAPAKRVEAASAKSLIDDVPELLPDKDIPGEVLEFFVPEVEEHLQIITDCLLALEAKPNEEDIHRLFRSMHTIKGSAAQVGWQRIATIAHRAEDLVGRLREGELKPSATIIDLCLETVDVIKKLVYRQWEDEASFQVAARTLIARLGRVAYAEDVGIASCITGAASNTASGSARLRRYRPRPLSIPRLAHRHRSRWGASRASTRQPVPLRLLERATTPANENGATGYGATRWAVRS